MENGVRKLSPASRHELVRKLKALDCEGLYPGGKHQGARKGLAAEKIERELYGDREGA